MAGMNLAAALRPGSALSFLADEGDEVGESVVPVLVILARAVGTATFHGRRVVGRGRAEGGVVRKT